MNLFVRVGLPYTMIGIGVVYGGIFLLKKIMAESDYVGTMIFAWLALFWFVYQPLFRRRLNEEKKRIQEKND
ncbi:MAG: hypothetical protein JXR25_12335 [Pontiellaceae bacterium]|nr:hypothetical protein [Pontiellaceae bacterium]